MGDAYVHDFGGDSEGPTESQNRGWVTRWLLGRPQPRQVRIAVLGYAVAILFGAASGIALGCGASAATALIVGSLAAGPMVVALVGQRITGVKALGVEISLAALSQSKAKVAGDDSAIAANLSAAAQDGAKTGHSGNQQLVQHFETLIDVAPKVLRVNLQANNYWWSTRIFLVAALAQDYTDVDAFVFVESGDEQAFVGIALTRAVRERLALQFPVYETAYRRARAAVPPQAPGDTDLDPKVVDIKNILEYGAWETALQQIADQQNAPEIGQENTLKELVTTKKLREWLGGDLDSERLPHEPPSALIAYRIISRERRYAALTDNRRLQTVVDRDELAINYASSGLAQVLAGPSPNKAGV